MNREDWLMAITAQFRPLFSAAGGEIPTNVRCATAFPSTGRKGRRIGECWDAGASADGVFEIMIRPDVADPCEAAAILAHELVHATVGLAAKHGKTFKRLAVAIGLTGKMTATTAGPGLAAKIATMVEAVGPLPHGALAIGGLTTAPPKQSTRMLKAECPECGYTVRITRKWVDEAGAPHCPLHGEMGLGS